MTLPDITVQILFPNGQTREKPLNRYHLLQSLFRSVDRQKSRQKCSLNIKICLISETARQQWCANDKHSTIILHVANTWLRSIHRSNGNNNNDDQQLILALQNNYNLNFYKQFGTWLDLCLENKQTCAFAKKCPSELFQPEKPNFQDLCISTQIIISSKK